MNDWTADKRWSDKFLPQIKRILGEHLIGEPSIEEDAERNTDLIVLKMEAVRIACRVRRYEYLARYGDQFTIRKGRPSGVKTELTKIIEGWGNYFFYGFSDEQGEVLAKWILCDLNALRLYINRELYAKRIPWESKQNADGSSDFACFRYAEIPGFLFAQGTQMACVV
jgi:hypothetical protein